MADTIIILGDWNSITPAAPAGRENVLFAVDRTGLIPKFSASVEKPLSVATFLIGIGGAIAAATDVAPVYRVKNAGTIYKAAARVKAGIAGDIAFMLRRLRNASPATTVNILTADLTIVSGSGAWVETTDFENDDLEVGDELLLDVTAGAPENATLELYWS